MEQGTRAVALRMLELLAHETLQGDAQAVTEALVRGRVAGGLAVPDAVNGAKALAATGMAPGTAPGSANQDTDEDEHARQLYAGILRNFERCRHDAALSRSLVDMVKELWPADGLGALLKTAARQVRQLLALDAVFVSVPDERPGRFRIVVADGHVSVASVGLRLAGGPRGFGGDVGTGATPVWTPDYLADNRFEHTAYTDRVVGQEGLRGIIAAPLLRDGARFGMVYGASRSVRRFTVAEVALMEKHAELVGAFIGNAEQLARGAAARTELDRYREMAEAGFDIRRRIDTCCELLDETLAEARLPVLVRGCARLLGFDVAVYCRNGTLSAASKPEAPENLPLEEAATTQSAADLAESAATGAGEIAKGAVRIEAGRWMVPIRAGAEHLGTLVTGSARPLSDRDWLLLRVVVRILAVSLRRLPKPAAEPEGPRREGLLEQLLTPDAADSAQLAAAQAHALGIDLDAPHVLVVARPEAEELRATAGWAGRYARRVNALFCMVEDCVALLLRGDDARAAVFAVHDELAAALAGSVTAGAGGPVTGARTEPERLRAGYGQARRCLSAMRALGMTGRAAAIGDLGFLGQLMAGGPDTIDLVASVVGPVFDYDLRRSAALVETLDAYFASGGNASAAAKALHVHPNTVSRRLERISELLGADWQEPRRILEIQVALRLARISAQAAEMDAAVSG